MKKITSIILVCVLLLGNAMPAAASDTVDTIEPRFTYIVAASADMQVSSWGVASCTGTLITRTQTPVKIRIRLQRLDGSFWETIKEWELTDTGVVSGTRQYAIYSGYSYRVYVLAYVFDADGNFLESAHVAKYLDY